MSESPRRTARTHGAMIPQGAALAASEARAGAAASVRTVMSTGRDSDRAAPASVRTRSWSTPTPPSGG